MNLIQTKFIAPAAIVLGGAIALVAGLALFGHVEPASSIYQPLAIHGVVLGMASVVLGIIALVRK